MWEYRGQKRPSFADPPGPGRESVWDYPRPPRIAPDSRRVLVRLGDLIIGDSDRTVRVLETASPPTFYLPPEDVRHELLETCAHQSWCEWKGTASYWRLATDNGPESRVAWCYLAPTFAFQAIAGYFSFYPGALECYVGGERVMPQHGALYGGWVTREIAGPFKGPGGTSNW